MEIYIFKIENKIIIKGIYMEEGYWIFNSNWICEKNIIITIGNLGYKCGGYAYYRWDVKEKDK